MTRALQSREFSLAGNSGEVRQKGKWRDSKRGRDLLRVASSEMQGSCARTGEKPQGLRVAHS